MFSSKAASETLEELRCLGENVLPPEVEEVAHVS